MSLERSMRGHIDIAVGVEMVATWQSSLGGTAVNVFIRLYF
jgi:hypothetical protein